MESYLGLHPVLPGYSERLPRSSPLPSAAPIQKVVMAVRIGTTTDSHLFLLACHNEQLTPTTYNAFSNRFFLTFSRISPKVTCYPFVWSAAPGTLPWKITSTCIPVSIHFPPNPFTRFKVPLTIYPFPPSFMTTSATSMAPSSRPFSSPWLNIPVIHFSVVPFGLEVVGIPTSS